MVETLQQKPFEERPSQKVGVSGYLRDSVFWGLLPFGLGAAAVAFGKTTKYKIFPLDGSPSLIQHAYEKLFKAAAKDAMNVDLGKSLNHWDRFALGRVMDEEAAKTLTKDIWNFIKTLEVAAIPTIFHFWKHAERQRISLTPIHDRLEKLRDLKPSDAELREENASLKQQLEYVQRRHGDRPLHKIEAVQHDGHAQHRAREVQA